MEMCTRYIQQDYQLVICQLWLTLFCCVLLLQAKRLATGELAAIKVIKLEPGLWGLSMVHTVLMYKW